MMEVAVDLHVHTNADADSRTPPRKMVDPALRRMGDFVLLGFVGHDFRPQVDVEGVLSVAGVEHEIRQEPTRLHVLRFPDHDLQILAHPQLTWPTETEAHARQWMRETDLRIDAVEAATSGRPQYEASVSDVVEVAGSDAHSPLVIGSAFMVVMVQEVSADAVMKAIKRGHVHTVIDRPPWHRRWLASAEKALSLSVSDPSAAVRVGRQRVKLKSGAFK